jgi:hypothetical protein
VTSDCAVYAAIAYYSSSLPDAEELHDILIARESEIIDFGFRVYEGRRGDFVTRPHDDDDKKSAQVRLIV